MKECREAGEKSEEGAGDEEEEGTDEQRSGVEHKGNGNGLPSTIPSFAALRQTTVMSESPLVSRSLEENYPFKSLGKSDGDNFHGRYKSSDGSKRK